MTAVPSEQPVSSPPPARRKHSAWLVLSVAFAVFVLVFAGTLAYDEELQPADDLLPRRPVPKPEENGRVLQQKLWGAVTDDAAWAELQDESRRARCRGNVFTRRGGTGGTMFRFSKRGGLTVNSIIRASGSVLFRRAGLRMLNNRVWRRASAPERPRAGRA